MSKITVRVRIRRHGDKDGDLLTPKGEEQITAAAKKNDANITWDLAAHSEMFRAQQTARLSLTATGQKLPDSKIVEFPGFGYDHAAHPDFPFPIEKKTAGGPYDQQTVGEWIMLWPMSCQKIRTTIGLSIRAIALIAAGYGEKDEYNIIVGAHSPTSELATRNLTTGMLNEADAIDYIVEIDRDTWKATIVSDTVVRA